MASANPYIICGALCSTDEICGVQGFSDEEGFQQAYDTDKYDREFCAQFGADAADAADADAAAAVHDLQPGPQAVRGDVHAVAGTGNLRHGHR